MTSQGHSQKNDRCSSSSLSTNPGAKAADESLVVMIEKAWSEAPNIRLKLHLPSESHPDESKLAAALNVQEIEYENELLRAHIDETYLRHELIYSKGRDALPLCRTPYQESLPQNTVSEILAPHCNESIQSAASVSFSLWSSVILAISLIHPKIPDQ